MLLCSDPSGWCTQSNVKTNDVECERCRENWWLQWHIDWSSDQTRTQTYQALILIVLLSMKQPLSFETETYNACKATGEYNFNIESLVVDPSMCCQEKVERTAINYQAPLFHNNFQGRTNVSWPILDKLLIGIIDNICNFLNSYSSLMKNKTSNTYKIVFHKFSQLWEEITWWKHPGFRIFRFFLTLAPSITTWLKALYQHQKKHFLLLLPVREC